MARRAKRKDFIPRPIVLAIIYGEIFDKARASGLFCDYCSCFLATQKKVDRVLKVFAAVLLGWPRDVSFSNSLLNRLLSGMKFPPVPVPA